jgi:hypothetical protein
MKRTVFVAVLFLSLAPIAGCRQHHERANLVAAVMTPNFRTGTLGIQCEVSASGTCYFALYGLSTGSTTLEVATGDRKVLTGINEDTLYCAESERALIERCTQLLLPREQTLVSRNIHSQEPLQLQR